MNSFNNLIAEYLTPNPKTVEGLNNSSYFYYRDVLYNKIHSLFKFSNFPDNWDINYFLDILYRNGFIGVVQKNSSVWALECGFSGINVYNNPTHINIANPVLGMFDVEIGIAGELIYFNRIDGRFKGMSELVTRYALLLAQCDASINTTLMNSRVAHVFEGETDAEVQSYKKMYDDVSAGKPAVFIKKGKSMRESNLNFLNVKNTYIGNDILITKRTIMNEFLTEIGINNANTDKRERLNTDEVNANNSEISANVIIWYDTLKGCIDKVNKLFNLNIQITINDHITGGDIDGMGKSDTAVRLSDV